MKNLLLKQFLKRLKSKNPAWFNVASTIAALIIALFVGDMGDPLIEFPAFLLQYKTAIISVLTAIIFVGQIPNKKVKDKVKMLLLLFMLPLVGCSTYQLTSLKGKTVTQVVPAGEHSIDGGRVMFLKQGKITFTVKTDSSWYWETPDKNGFSKVTGVGWIQGETNNSARLVYINKDNNVHQFWSYFYVNGMNPQEDKTLKKLLLEVEIGKSYSGWVGYDNGFLTVEIGGQHHSVKGKGHGVPFLQNAYVGGTYVINKDWKVQIKHFI